MSLTVNSLSKRYGNVWALRDVSFEAEGGSVIGLFGASGSGKTSLLRVIAGQLKPNGGSVFLDETDLATLKAKERPVTYVGDESPGLISGILSQFTSGASTGEKALKGFDAAMEETGKIVLLDDPFRRMDRDLRGECFARIRKIGKMRGKVVVFASSDFEYILDVADEVAILSNGSILQAGAPQEIYDGPETVEVARLTGENNLFPARRLTSTDVNLPEFQTVEGSHRLFAANVETKRLGAIDKNITLAIRPEQVVMSMGASFPEDNLLKGVVTAIEQRGPTSLIRFDANGLQIKVRTFKVVGLSIGNECMLGLPPHRIIILKD